MNLKVFSGVTSENIGKRIIKHVDQRPCVMICASQLGEKIRGEPLSSKQKVHLKLTEYLNLVFEGP